MARRVLQESESTLQEQIRQAEFVVPVMIKAIKEYVPDFLFAGKYADPAPHVKAGCEHIKPSNDTQEQSFS